MPAAKDMTANPPITHGIPEGAKIVGGGAIRRQPIAVLR